MAPPTTAASVLWGRDVSSDFNNAKTTLSSWDNCMSKAYCKWPVIVAIIIASLIVLSVLFCIFRVCCCGLECCCGCLSCCNACCPKPRGGGRRNAKQYQPTPQQPPSYGYNPGPQPWTPQPYHQIQPQPQDTMMYGAAKGLPDQHQPTSRQFARFSNPLGKSKKGGARANEDSLPAMPSWDAAPERHVEDTSYHAPSEAETNRHPALAHGQEGIPLQDRKQPSPIVTSQAPGAYGVAGAGALSGGGYGHGQDNKSPQHDAYAHPAADYASPTHDHYQNTSYAAPQQQYTSPTGYHQQYQYQNQQQLHPADRTVSPISPITSPSPAPSSVYSARPPPSYHTYQNGVPSRGPSTRSPMPLSTPSPLPSIPQGASAPTPLSYSHSQSRSPQQRQYPQYQPYTPPPAAELSQGQGQYQAYKPYEGRAGESDGGRAW